MNVALPCDFRAGDLVATFAGYEQIRWTGEQEEYFDCFVPMEPAIWWLSGDACFEVSKSGEQKILHECWFAMWFSISSLSRDVCRTWRNKVNTWTGEIFWLFSSHAICDMMIEWRRLLWSEQKWWAEVSWCMLLWHVIFDELTYSRRLQDMSKQGEHGNSSKVFTVFLPCILRNDDRVARFALKWPKVVDKGIVMNIALACDFRSADRVATFAGHEQIRWTRERQHAFHCFLAM